MKLCVTAVAGAYVAFPAWLALTKHVPAATIVTVPVGETVQTEFPGVEKLTARPELAVALTVNGAVTSTPASLCAVLTTPDQWAFAPTIACGTDGGGGAAA